MKASVASVPTEAVESTEGFQWKYVWKFVDVFVMFFLGGISKISKSQTGTKMN
jgi:hypothetical protein